MADLSGVSLIDQMRVMATQAGGTPVTNGTDSFNTALQQALFEVNNADRVANDFKARYETNDPNVSLAQVMIAGQKSNLGFEAALMVRNKVVQAYQDIMSMPV